MRPRRPALWPRALQAIADAFGDVGAILIWQRDDGGFGDDRLADASIRASEITSEHVVVCATLRAARAIERGFLRGDEARSPIAMS